MNRATKSPHVLIIVENLPVPLDRRVWLECQALIQRGYRVSVICPKGPGDPARQRIGGVQIYKYKPAPEANGTLGDGHATSPATMFEDVYATTPPSLRRQRQQAGY